MKAFPPSYTQGRTEILPAESTTDSDRVADKITSKYMTKYEKARVLGSRALQLRSVIPAVVAGLYALVSVEHICLKALAKIVFQ